MHSDRLFYLNQFHLQFYPEAVLCKAYVSYLFPSLNKEKVARVHIHNCNVIFLSFLFFLLQPFHIVVSPGVTHFVSLSFHFVSDF